METAITLEEYLLQYGGISGIFNVYDRVKINDRIALQSEVSKYVPCKVLVINDIPDVYVNHEYLNIKVSYNKSTKKYELLSLQEYLYCSTKEITAITNRLNKPNGIGKLSLKNINEYINYLELRHDALKKLEDDNSEKVKLFLNRISDMNIPIQRAGNFICGELEKNGLCYSFNIHFGVINECIKLSIENITLDNFILLSDNKYTNNA